jgi:hypothetical protein
MVSKVPVGLFITHHLARALTFSPGLMLVGRRNTPRRAEPGPAAGHRPGRALAILAVAARAATAVSYATLEQFVIPLRGSREFGSTGRVIDGDRMRPVQLQHGRLDAAARYPQGRHPGRPGVARARACDDHPLRHLPVTA